MWPQKVAIEASCWVMTFSAGSLLPTFQNWKLLILQKDFCAPGKAMTTTAVIWSTGMETAHWRAWRKKKRKQACVDHELRISATTKTFSPLAFHTSEIPRTYLCSVGWAEAVWQLTLWRRAFGSCVGVLLDWAGDLVGGVSAVCLAVTEERLLQAGSVTALKLTLGTNRLLRLEVGTGDTRLGQPITIVDLEKKKVNSCHHHWVWELQLLYDSSHELK